MTTMVLKYDLVQQARFEVALPRGAKPISVGMQSGWPKLWAIVDVDEMPEPRAFYMLGTGHPMPDRLGAFVGTLFDGAYVWHVFEEEYMRAPMEQAPV